MQNLIMVMLLGALFVFVIVITIYIVQGIFLNKLNKLMYGKGTPMAWIPVANIYLLGKLTVNKIVGWILVACVFLTGTLTTTVNGVEKTYSILPESISSILTPLYSLTSIGLLIYAIVKYNKLKKRDSFQNLQQNKLIANEVQPIPTIEPAVPVQEIQTQEVEKKVPTIGSEVAPVPNIEQQSMQEINDQPAILQPIAEPKQQPQFCTNCGAPTISGAKFCIKCGKQL